MAYQHGERIAALAESNMRMFIEQYQQDCAKGERLGRAFIKHLGLSRKVADAANSAVATLETFRKLRSDALSLGFVKGAESQLQKIVKR